MRFNKKKRHINNRGYAAFFPAPLQFTPVACQFPANPIFYMDNFLKADGLLPNCFLKTREK